MRECVMNIPAGRLVGKAAVLGLVYVLPYLLLLRGGMTSTCVSFV